MKNTNVCKTNSNETKAWFKSPSMSSSSSSYPVLVFKVLRLSRTPG